MNQHSAHSGPEAALAALERAMHDRDAGAVARLHVADATIYDLAPPLGGHFDEAKLAQWFASWAGPVEETWDSPALAVSGDLAVCHGMVRIRTQTQGGEEAAWWMRRTVCLRRDGDNWRIFHDHTSVPFYMDGTDRAALDLEPEQAA